MAEKRMFSKSIIDSDSFLDMPLTTQALYFHLAMRADDDGFLNNSKKIMRVIGANQNDMDLLLVKKFIISFEDGICVIKHWRIHNYIQTDRYHETNYKQEKSMLCLDDNKAYTLEDTGKKLIGNKVLYTDCIQNGSSDKTRLDKNRLDKTRKDKTRLDKKENVVGGGVDIFSYFQQRGFVSISSMMAQDITELVNEYSIEEVKKAVDIADDNQKHTLSYVKGILKHRRANGEKQKDADRIIAERIANGEDPF